MCLIGIRKLKGINMILGEPLLITKQVVNVFSGLDIKYMVGGSLASSLHGIPRATQDIDIVVDIKPENIKDLVNILKNDFYIDEDMIRTAIFKQTSFNIIHLKTMFKVDIFIFKHDEASKEEMARRKSYKISDNYYLFVSSAEDIILHKLFWYELGSRISDRQWTDVIGVLQVQGNQLDYKYLKKCAIRMNINELLTKAIEETEK